MDAGRSFIGSPRGRKYKPGQVNGKTWIISGQKLIRSGPGGATSVLSVSVCFNVLLAVQCDCMYVLVFFMFN